MSFKGASPFSTTEKTATAHKVNERHLRIEILHDIERFMSLQMSHTNLVKAIMEKHGISNAQTRKYVESVEKSWAKAPPPDREALRQKLRLSLSDLYQRALEDGNLAVADRILDKIARVDGLYAPTQLSVAAGVSTPALDPERAREKIRELLAKHPEINRGKPLTVTVPPPGRDEIPSIGTDEEDSN